MPETTGNTYVDTTLTNVVSFGDNVGISMIFLFPFFYFLTSLFLVFDFENPQYYGILFSLGLDCCSNCFLAVNYLMSAFNFLYYYSIYFLI